MQRVPLHPGGRHSKKKKPGHGGWWKRPHSKKPKKNKEKDQEDAATPLHDDKSQIDQSYSSSGKDGEIRQLRRWGLTDNAWHVVAHIICRPSFLELIGIL